MNQALLTALVASRQAELLQDAQQARLVRHARNGGRARSPRRIRRWQPFAARILRAHGDVRVRVITPVAS